LALGVLAMTVIGLLVAWGLIASAKERGSGKPAQAQAQVDAGPDPGPGFRQNATDAARAGFSFMFLGMLCVVGVLLLVLQILVLAWVARDTRARGVDGGAVWVLIVLCTPIIGLLVYLASRPHGPLAACARCGNKRLQAALACPHCGQASAA
jgi:hypothetical protein